MRGVANPMFRNAKAAGSKCRRLHQNALVKRSYWGRSRYRLVARIRCHVARGIRSLFVGHLSPNEVVPTYIVRWLDTRERLNVRPGRGV
jgi:hypothetical protein